ncbi:MAG: FAD-dependent 5-carboxymethylaminomethyl-2-thiouridine(34) oxidoreductase MnmC [Pelistega sp.]|nr:FAD-dependent 5-carboxymethylaminomethyl-2-thiouridine(34) oxidoreductase MnmC [Pelistega sp.]
MNTMAVISPSVFSDVSAQQILNYAQQVNDDPCVPLTIAIVGEHSYAYIHQLYQWWQRQQRPWHILLVDRQYQQCLWRQELPSDWQAAWQNILPLPGMQRVDIVPYRFSVSMLFDVSEQAWSKLSARINVFVLDKPSLQDVRYAFRMSVANTLVYSSSALSEDYLTLFKEQQFTVVEQDTTRHILQLKSRRPETLPVSVKGRTAVVIGAGVAGAGVAFALANRGWRVNVVDPILANPPDEEAYRYASGAVTPLITADDCHKARLSRAGVLRAHARWQSIAKQAGIRHCGTLELNRDKGHAKDLLDAVQQLNFPKEWVRLVSVEEASSMAGIPINQEGAFFPFAMQIPPVRLARTLLQHENIHAIPSRLKAIRIESTGDFTLLTEDGELTAPVVILATAMNSRALLQDSGLGQYTLKSGQSINALQRLDSLHALAGEVMMVPATALQGGPQCVVGGQGYYLPAQKGFCVMGSTYEHGNLAPQVTQVGQQTIWQKIPLRLPVTLEELQAQNVLKGRACVRAVLQGRLPIIAELPQHKNLWVTTAYASHGMTWSSLAGDIIGASVEGEPLPIERDLLNAISFKL